ncbi:hypothetical protein FEM48_Zijuj12G0155800 [Ziziphus jujuba var. spinosa]|uniref:RING-type E3 ubiquitin transferase n=1 Tax=Ziziphus jujuba var. spinosa TaxID=714518 RepID=A0A978UE63_ZIZJJ|nr:hypothetical protein FEM48_Zijuj12G0155800 [Ziziphus jujuba var. spinosa]
MEEETIMASLATLTLPQLSDLTNSVFSQTHHHHLRLSALLSSPTLFSLTLHRLHFLSLPHKTLLIARHLLSSLRHLTFHFQPTTTTLAFSRSTAINCRDLDAVLLLLFLCEVRQHNPEALQTPPSKWREVLGQLYAENMMRVSGIGVYNGTALVPFIEMVTRCLRFVDLMGGCGGGGKGGKEVPASVTAVVALPSVEVSGDGVIECAVCKEEMKKGRDVCELPCQHLFHWMCILPWLRKKNTCPCCRFQLPTDDVFGEIQRLWEVLVKIGGKSL